MKLKEALKFIPKYNIVEISEKCTVDAPSVAEGVPNSKHLEKHLERTVSQIKARGENLIRICVYDR